MQILFRTSVFFFLLLGLAGTTTAQKKVKNFQVTKVIPYSAEKVWAVVGEDYGAIANSHPKIITSEYINGSLKAEEGAQRVCNFNEKGTQYLKEKIVGYDPEGMSFKNQVFKAGKFPVDPEYTYGIYKVEAIDENTSRFTFDMTFRTKPAFLGGLMKGNFIKLINDYALAIQHHIATGEAVNKGNFKEIKKSYTAP